MKNLAKDFLPFCKPSIGREEQQAVQAVLASGWLTTGPKCQELEEAICQYTGAKYAIAVSSATAGMHVLLMALGIGPGDEVITPSLTWVSTVNMITLLGATPVFVDVDKDNLMLQSETIQLAITANTKAIIPVHYAGAPFDIDAINQVAHKYDVPVIADAAHALGTSYKDRMIGEQGHAVFSLHAIKNITCGEGGIVVTDDEKLAEKIRCLKFHGLSQDTYNRETQGRAPQAQVVHPGFKYNLTDMQAAIALEQLKKINIFNDKRRFLLQRYQKELGGSGLEFLTSPRYSHQHAAHLCIVRVVGYRNNFMQQLLKLGIGTGIHFMAIHSQIYYKRKYPKVCLPNTEWNSANICSLPLFPELTIIEQDRVINSITQVIQKRVLV